MWAVTITGAPKTWAMQFIEDHEATPRRWYGGAVGAIGFDGGMNTGLTLAHRAHPGRDRGRCGAGATLLFNSDPAAEERETQIKARALMETLKDAERAAAGPVTGTGAASAESLLADGRPGAGLRGPARGPPGLVRAHPGRLLPPAGGGGHHPAGRLPARAAGLLRSRPGGAPPGPGLPADFGCDDLLTELDARGLPAFGVCLGLQAMIEHAGGELSLLAEPAHGKAGRGPGAGRRPAERAAGGVHRARHHSIYARPEQVKGGFEATATTPDGVVMAIEDAAAGRWGVQFHPESILTASGRAGHQVIANVLRLCRARAARTAP